LVNVVSEKSSILKEYAEYIFGTIDKAVEGLTEKEMMWRPTEQSNNIEWILNHLARLSNVSLPRIISGDSNYMPKGWPQDYKDQHYKMEKMVKDIQAGKKVVLEGIGKLTNAQLEEEIPLWGGKQKRKTGLFAYLGELIHHKGQIAYIRGTVKRLKEKDPKFLA
jgi:uncharacterized damage-inducible protein DinB